MTNFELYNSWKTKERIWIIVLSNSNSSESSELISSVAQFSRLYFLILLSWVSNWPSRLVLDSQLETEKLGEYSNSKCLLKLNNFDRALAFQESYYLKFFTCIRIFEKAHLRSDFRKNPRKYYIFRADSFCSYFGSTESS